MRQRQRGKLLRLPSVVINGRREAFLLHCGQADLKLGIQVTEDIPGILFCRNRRIQSREMADLLRDDGTDACKAGIERLGYRRGFPGQQGGKILFWDSKGVGFVHGIRNEIFPPGQHLAHRADLRGDMLDAVDDLSIFGAENNIAVFSHDLHDEHLAAKVAQFV